MNTKPFNTAVLPGILELLAQVGEIKGSDDRYSVKLALETCAYVLEGKTDYLTAYLKLCDVWAFTGCDVKTHYAFKGVIDWLQFNDMNNFNDTKAYLLGA